MRRAEKHLTPLVAERLRKMEELGKDWPGKPVQFFLAAQFMEIQRARRRTT
jgi:hypothetical protein